MNITRLEMTTKLIENEIDWLIGDPTRENTRSIIKFFSMGGYEQYSDKEIKRQYENLTA
jgi:hypothetical protein